jgi:hypothetical protein
LRFACCLAYLAPAESPYRAQARIKALQVEMAATEADCAVLRAAATESLTHAAERDRLLRERVGIDEAARARGAVISRQVSCLASRCAFAALTDTANMVIAPCSQAAAAAESDAAADALRAQLAEQQSRVDELALRCRGGTSLRVFFGAPWLVAQSAARLAAPPPAGAGATLCALPGAAGLVLFGGQLADGSLGEAYGLSIEGRAWTRAPGGRHAGRAGHAAAALRGAGAVPAGALGAAGGAVAVFGGVSRGDDGNDANAAPCADVAVLAATADGALRWLCAAAEAGGDAPPPRSGAAAAATDDECLYVFGGADVAGRLSADLACLDVAAMTWLPPPPGGGPRGGPGPAARRDASLCADAAARGLYLFGGIDADGAFLGDLHRYDADAGAWAPLEAAAGEAPPPRAGAALAVAGRYILLAGGTTQATDDATSAHVALRDAWALDTERLLWERLQDDDGAGTAGASLCAWRGRTLYRLRPADDEAASEGDGHPESLRFSLLEVSDFALPDDVDALVSSRRATGGAAAAAGATLALWAEPRRGATWLDFGWRPPARNAERCVGYKLMLAPAGATAVRTVYSGRGTAARVGGLRPSTEYICVVKARYEGGGAAHLWSDTRAFRTAASRPVAAPDDASKPPFCSLPSRLGQPAAESPRRGSGSGGFSPTSSPRRHASGGPFDLASMEGSLPLEEDEGGPVAAAAADAAAFFAAASRRRNAAPPPAEYDDGSEPLDAALYAHDAAAAAAEWDADEGASAILIAEDSAEDA